jgi:organic hydroperoxide reductase OsmC/OhrA
MKISASIQNSAGNHQVTLKTNDHRHALEISPKASGLGSRTNGGELLFLALATCYCNDIYREAVKRNIVVASVEVAVEGDFEAEGAPAENVTYSAKVSAKASDAEIRALMMATDRVAEIQNTVRTATTVTLDTIETVAL